MIQLIPASHFVKEWLGFISAKQRSVDLQSTWYQYIVSHVPF